MCVMALGAITMVNSRKLRKNMFLSLWLISVISVVSCSGGGRGIRPVADNDSGTFSAGHLDRLANEAMRQAPADAAPEEMNEEVVAELESLGYVGSNSFNYNRVPPSESLVDGNPKDPYEIVPDSWPEQLRFHPEAWIAVGGSYGNSGYYVIGLISPDRATPFGIQNFHLAEVSNWETVMVTENLPENDQDKTCLLIISAENPDLKVEICTGTNDEEIMSQIPHSHLMRDRVGLTPLWVKISYDHLAPKSR
jgi:hypothetical protein